MKEKDMLTRWNPYREFALLQEDANRLFDIFTRRGSGTTPMTGWNPAVDILEDEDAYTITAELPGLDKDDVEIHLENRTLTIQGERAREKEVKEESYHLTERFFGRFSRSFTLPSSINQSKIAANFKEGVLQITLPKMEEVKPKLIEVKCG